MIFFNELAGILSKSSEYFFFVLNKNSLIPKETTCDVWYKFQCFIFTLREKTFCCLFFKMLRLLESYCLIEYL